MPYKCSIPKNIYQILEFVPAADRPENESDFWKAVSGELSMLIEYASHAEQPHIFFGTGAKSGGQYLWEFWVSDMVKPLEDKYNWHGQNISQWNYAGAILLQNNRVSTHH